MISSAAAEPEFPRSERESRRSILPYRGAGRWSVGKYPPDCHIYVECYHSATADSACRECWIFSRIHGFLFSKKERKKTK